MSVSYVYLFDLCCRSCPRVITREERKIHSSRMPNDPGPSSPICRICVTRPALGSAVDSPLDEFTVGQITHCRWNICSRCVTLSRLDASVKARLEIPRSLRTKAKDFFEDIQGDDENAFEIEPLNAGAHSSDDQPGAVLMQVDDAASGVAHLENAVGAVLLEATSQIGASGGTSSASAPPPPSPYAFELNIDHGSGAGAGTGARAGASVDDGAAARRRGRTTATTVAAASSRGETLPDDRSSSASGGRKKRSKKGIIS